MTPSRQLNLAGRLPLLPTRVPMREAVAEITARKAAIRQERLSGIHNPWGQGSSFTDPWSFLDLCESAAVIDTARDVVGLDIILWDSELFPEARRYREFLRQRREGRYWPVSPLGGAIVLVPVGREEAEPRAVKLSNVGPEILDEYDPLEPLYVIRLMPAASHFERDPKHPAHRACMEEQVLVNYANRPLWLLCGTDKGNNDFVIGFAPAVPVWASSALSAEQEEK